MPLEYLNSEYEREFRDLWNLSSNASAYDYLEEVLNRTTTSNGVFGLKIHWHQLSNLLLRLFPARTTCESINELLYLFPDVHYVFLSRRDKVRQAVSYARALQTNIWWRIDGVCDPQERCVEPCYDPEQIATLLERLQLYEASWESFFSQMGLTPLRLIYEDFVSHEAVESALDFLGNSTRIGEIPAPRLRRQADEISEHWSLMFRRSMGLGRS
jgi:LPS sulfotransferase NodH